MRKILLVVASLLLLILAATAEQPDTSRVQELLGIEITESAPIYKLGRQIRTIDNLIDECYALRATLVTLYRETSGHEDAYPVTINISDMSYEELVALRGQIDERLAILASGANEEEPDYAALPLDEAITAIAENSNDGVCYFREYTFYPGEEIHIHVDLKGIYDDRNTISDTIRFAIDFAKRAFTRDDIPMIRFFFHEAGHNASGQRIDMQTITMKIKKTTFAKIDIDYYYKWTANNQLAFFKAIDAYTLHKDYKQVVK